jgi:hypothetical protein
MASLAEITKLLDEKLSAQKKELLDEPRGTILKKFEADIEDLKGQAAATKLAIKRLEEGSSSKNHSKDEPTDNHDDGTSDAEIGDWKPKVHQLEFPTFDGSEDALPWLMRVEQFFEGQGTPEGGKVWLALYHLAGRASLWYRCFKRANGAPPSSPSC